MIPRRCPPHGRELEAILAAPTCWPDYAGTSPDGHRLSIWVAIGPEAWAWCRRRLGRAAVLLCPEVDPPAFDWSSCAGHDPVLIHRAGDVSPARVHALAAALLRDGVRTVLDTATGDIHRRVERAAS